MAEVRRVDGNVVHVDFGYAGKRAVSKRELARRWRCSPKTIDRRVAEGMPSYMDGNRRMFDLETVTRWRDARKEEKRGRQAAFGRS